MYKLTLNASFGSFQYINALLLVDNFYASFDKFLDKHLKLDHYRQQYTTACYDEKKMLFSVFCTKISIHLEVLFDGFISIEVSFVVDVQSFLLCHCITTEGYWNTMARPLLKNFPFGCYWQLHYLIWSYYHLLLFDLFTYVIKNFPLINSLISSSVLQYSLS